MSVFVPKQRRPLSDGATRLLRQIIAHTDRVGQPPTLADLGGGARTLDALHVLADRWLVVIVGGRVKPRQRGRDLLRQSFYRDRGR